MQWARLVWKWFPGAMSSRPCENTVELSKGILLSSQSTPLKYSEKGRGSVKSAESRRALLSLTISRLDFRTKFRCGCSGFCIELCVFFLLLLVILLELINRLTIGIEVERVSNGVDYRKSSVSPRMVFNRHRQLQPCRH